LARQSAQTLLQGAEKAFSDRDSNRNLFVDCYELLSPYRNTLTASGQSFNKPTRQYDSTGQISAANFVNTLQSNFTPVFTKWANLVAGPGIPEDKRPALNAQLEKINDVIFAYINSSNFSTASAEMYFEWGIGTGALWLYEGDNEQPLNFVATPISQIGIAEGKNGAIEARYRKYKCKGKHLESLYGPEIKLPEQMAAQIQRDGEKEIDLIECFYYDYEEFAWHYDVVAEEGKATIYQKDFAEEICFTPRWLKIPGFAYGVGPFVMALADIKTLNKLKEFLLRSAALDVAGVYTIVGDGALNPNNINIEPNTFIPVERNGGENGPSIQRLDTTANFELQEYLSNNLQDQIRKTLLDNRLPAETPQPKTAFEIAQRMREFQIDIGSAYGRGMFEYVVPLYRRVASILVAKGLLQLPEGFMIDNFFVKIQVVSPIARTQQVEEVQNFMQGFGMSQMISPELALMRYKTEEIPKWLNEMLGGPAKLMRDDVEAEQLQGMVANLVAQTQLAQQPTGAA
jgi:hypothetical protein